jgi:hypothetical protein
MTKRKACKSRKWNAYLFVLLLCLLCTGCAGNNTTERNNKPNIENPTDDKSGNEELNTDPTDGKQTDPQNFSVSGLNNAQNDAKMKMDQLKSADFKGFDFTIAAVSPQTFVSDSDDNFVNTSLYFRNKLIKDKYNINISIVGLPDMAKTKVDLQNAVLAGNQYADLLSVPMKSVGTFAADGLLLNMRSLPFLDFNADYMKNSLADEMTIKGRTYSLYGDAVLQDDYTWVMFFNKNLTSLVSTATPYELMKSGDWNWETVLWMSAQLPKTNEALNEGDKKRPVLKLFGQGNFSNIDNFRNGVWESGEKAYYSKDNNGYFYSDFMNQDFLSVIGTLRRITMTENAFLHQNLSGTEQDLFADKQLMFYPNRLSYAKKLINSGVSFGIAPMPKLTNTQKEYASWLDSDVPCVSVPVNCSNTERTGLVINALYASSYRHLGMSQKLDYINYYFSDNSSSSLYDRFVNSKKTSIAYSLGEGIPVFSDSSYGFLKSAVEDGGGMESLYKKGAESLAKYEIKHY